MLFQMLNYFQLLPKKRKGNQNLPHTIQRYNRTDENINSELPNRIALRTRSGSSKKVSFGGKGVTIFPDFRSSMPVIDEGKRKNV